MLFHYIAADNYGKMSEGDLDADSVAQVLEHLSTEKLRPISVKPVRERQSGPSIFSKKISLGDKVFLTKYLSLMLKVGTDLLAAINILIADFEKPAVKNLLLEIRENLTKGQQFYVAFEKHPMEFSSVFTNLVKAAEASGNLQKTFEDLSKTMQEEADLRSRVRGAFIYPIILLGVASAVFVFLVTFALPKIAKVFNDAGVNPPAFSKIVFGIGLFVNDNLLAIIIGMVILVLPLTYFFLRNTVGKMILHRTLAKLPVVKNVYRDLAVQRFASTFSSLMRAGLPILQTARITADVVGSEEFKIALIRIADDGLSKGLTLGEAFKRELIFPRVVTNLIAVSEKAGHLEDVLDTIAGFYAQRVDASIRNLVAFLEPILLLTMGGMVAAIALSIIVPIYQLTNNF